MAPNYTRTVSFPLSTNTGCGWNERARNRAELDPSPPPPIPEDYGEQGKRVFVLGSSRRQGIHFFLFLRPHFQIIPNKKKEKRKNKEEKIKKRERKVAHFVELNPKRFFFILFYSFLEKYFSSLMYSISLHFFFINFYEYLQFCTEKEEKKQ